MWIKTCVRIYFLLYLQTVIGENSRKYVDLCRLIARGKRWIYDEDKILESG
jgi:hypothetical protein